MVPSGATGLANVVAAGANVPIVSVAAHVAEAHHSQRAGWLRAAVLGANDGLLSVGGLLIGVAAANGSKAAVLTAGLAGLAAGALSMGVGEYISVSSQRDAEDADLRVEGEAIEAHPMAEMHELAKIYEDRGVEPGLARLVAEQLMAHDAVGAHARDELGITDVHKARPMQAAWISITAFSVGALVPLLSCYFGARPLRIALTVLLTIAALLGLGAWGAQLGGAPRGRAALRTLALSVVSMAVTYGIGRVVGATV
jgi:VIT1/CCC1 family predicted Fe2+/Mn2+ transporter